MPPTSMGLEIKFQPGSPNPARVFKSMSALIEAFEQVDRTLVRCIDEEIRPALILEDIEASSIRAWLTTVLNAIDDDALKSMDWKKAVGKYLVKGKYILIDYLSHTTTVSTKGELDEIQGQILEAAKETDVRRLPLYEPIRPREIVVALDVVSKALGPLQEGDSAKYLSELGDLSMNLTFAVEPRRIEELFTREQVTNQTTMLLKVKKPDYLGASQWDVRHEGRTIQVSIEDREWLRGFQERRIVLGPGDAIEAEVLCVVNYGFDNEVVSSSYTVLRVIQVHRDHPGGQLLMPHH